MTNTNLIVEPVGCYRNHTDAEFSFNYEIPFREIGKDLNVESGKNATFLWQNLNTSTTYEWYIEVVDSSGAKNVSDVWNFTTGSSEGEKC